MGLYRFVRTELRGKEIRNYYVKWRRSKTSIWSKWSYLDLSSQKKPSYRGSKNGDSTEKVAPFLNKMKTMKNM